MLEASKKKLNKQQDLNSAAFAFGFVCLLLLFLSFGCRTRMKCIIKFVSDTTKHKQIKILALKGKMISKGIVNVTQFHDF